MKLYSIVFIRATGDFIDFRLIYGITSLIHNISRPIEGWGGPAGAPGPPPPPPHNPPGGRAAPAIN